MGTILGWFVYYLAIAAFILAALSGLYLKAYYSSLSNRQVESSRMVLIVGKIFSVSMAILLGTILVIIVLYYLAGH